MAEQWQPIETAPYGREVLVRVTGKGRGFPAILVRDGSMTTEGRPCDQWQATTDIYPNDWSDGACWAINADEVASAQPKAWRHTAPETDHG